MKNIIIQVTQSFILGNYMSYVSIIISHGILNHFAMVLDKD